MLSDKNVQLSGIAEKNEFFRFVAHLTLRINLHDIGAAPAARMPVSMFTAPFKQVA